MILESKACWGRVCDISKEEMYIETGECLPINARFRARLALETPLPMECVVRRIVLGRAIGVTISFINEEGKARFMALLLALGREVQEGAAEATIAPPSQSVLSAPWSGF